MLYTLISYKPSNTDYCRGCLASYSSDHEIYVSSELEAIAEQWAKLRRQNRSFDDREAGFEFTLLIDGLPAANAEVCDLGTSEFRDKLWRRQVALADEFSRIRDRVAAIVAERDSEAADAKEAAKRAVLARLALKYRSAP